MFSCLRADRLLWFLNHQGYNLCFARADRLLLLLGQRMNISKLSRKTRTGVQIAAHLSLSLLLVLFLFLVCPLYSSVFV